MKILNLAFYKFVDLEGPALTEWRRILRAECTHRGLRGTILLGTEGINASLAGEESSARVFMSWIGSFEPFRNLDFKLSFSETVPFQRLFVKVKKEIIPLGMGDIIPARETGPRISAEELCAWLDEKREVLLVDTRNRFEVETGTFEGAVDLGLRNFREFGEKLMKLPAESREKPVVMFCTGGIRCEKATALAMKEGFKQVYQLDGGILRYFEKCGSAHFKGKCFVFDERVAIAP